ncbi:cyclic nucleotide-gated ion channel 1 isoform X2 [Ziziphus jujuba]|uniref:Cyclic nucleotide-gated ion channel 1 isoform X2 n=1 Tax=Ziziphus jujuba TaxID=326968 RepID=A0ABM3IF19_ZIZJJ|nr:cyclic nucleotide-gated ion channel 1 isoform X2 [Ziziphus jujuba]
MSWLTFLLFSLFHRIRILFQVAILILLPKWKTKSKSSLHTKTFPNAVILSQYVPRIFRIYLSCVEFTRSAGMVAGTLWVKGALNFFLYILASHILGSFWYFFSIQRETSCWKQACQGKTGQCATRICDCGSSNATLLDLSCPKDPSNTTTLFDFGIFLDALKSDVVDSNLNDFPKKVFYCFWWGLRHLSSLGDNLETSTYTWENCFAVSISIIGLLLFLYLIGNIQIYMQLAATRSEDIRQKMKSKIIDIDTWIEKNDLPKSWKPVMVQKLQHILEKENRDVDVENLFSLLPAADRMSIKHHLCIKILRKVRVFQNMKQSVLEDICSHLKPVIYGENSYIVRDGDPLDRMLFVTQGTLLAFTSSRSNSNAGSSSSASSSGKSIFSTSSGSMRRLKKGDYHGEELLEWSLTHLSFTEFPISTANVMCHTKVEGFVLKANDLLNAVKRYWWHFKRLSPYSSSNVSHLQVERWQFLASSVIQTLWRRKRAKKPANYFRHVHGGNLQGSSDK